MQALLHAQNIFLDMVTLMYISMYDLPLIRHNIDRLVHNIELTPFKYLIAENIPAIMTAHIAVPSLRSCELRQAGPALEKHTNVPASLSYSVVTELLKNELGFTGLVITDGLGMRGVTKNYEPGYVELNALLAGNDILLCPVDVPCAVDLIMHAIENEQFSEDELDARVLKILSAKELVFMQRNKGPFALSLSKNGPIHTSTSSARTGNIIMTTYIQSTHTISSERSTIIP